MIKSSTLAFVAGAAIGLMFIAPTAPDRFKDMADALDCDPASTVQWDAECDQAGAAMRLLSIAVFPVFLGEVFSYAARRYERRRRGREKRAGS